MLFKFKAKAEVAQKSTHRFAQGIKAAFVGLAVFTVALSAPQVVLAADAPVSIKIGSIIPQTGPSAPMGLSVEAGERVAIAEINAKGGVLGRPLELVTRDDQAKTEDQTGEQ